MKVWLYIFLVALVLVYVMVMSSATWREPAL